MTPRPANGFTMKELLVSIAIVSALITCVMVIASKAKGEAQSVQCMSNLRQWGIALHGYMGDNNGKLPRRGQGVQVLRVIDRPDDWFNALPPYLQELPYQELVARGQPPQPGVKSSFVCPSVRKHDNDGHFLCYGMNMHLSRWDRAEPSRLSELGRVDNLVFMADSPGGYASTVPSASRYSVSARHGGRANVLFVDGHVESFEGDHLGCGTGARSHSRVRWKVDENDPWNPR